MHPMSMINAYEVARASQAWKDSGERSPINLHALAQIIESARLASEHGFQMAVMERSGQHAQLISQSEGVYLKLSAENQEGRVVHPLREADEALGTKNEEYIDLAWMAGRNVLPTSERKLAVRMIDHPEERKVDSSVELQYWRHLSGISVHSGHLLGQTQLSRMVAWSDQLRAQLNLLTQGYHTSIHVLSGVRWISWIAIGLIAFGQLPLGIGSASVIGLLLLSWIICVSWQRRLSRDVHQTLRACADELVALPTGQWPEGEPQKPADSTSVASS